MSENTVASPEEVLATLTAILRGEMTEEKGGPKISERSRAAELFGKRYGLFDKPEPEEADAGMKKALPQVLAAVARLKEDYAAE